MSKCERPTPGQSGESGTGARENREEEEKEKKEASFYCPTPCSLNFNQSINQSTFQYFNYPVSSLFGLIWPLRWGVGSHRKTKVFQVSPSANLSQITSVEIFFIKSASSSFSKFQISSFCTLCPTSMSTRERPLGPTRQPVPSHRDFGPICFRQGTASDLPFQPVVELNSLPEADPCTIQ